MEISMNSYNQSVVNILKRAREAVANVGDNDLRNDIDDLLEESKEDKTMVRLVRPNEDVIKALGDVLNNEDKNDHHTRDSMIKDVLRASGGKVNPELVCWYVDKIFEERY